MKFIRFILIIFYVFLELVHDVYGSPFEEFSFPFR